MLLGFHAGKALQLELNQLVVILQTYLTEEDLLLELFHIETVHHSSFRCGASRVMAGIRSPIPPGCPEFLTRFFYPPRVPGQSPERPLGAAGDSTGEEPPEPQDYRKNDELRQEWRSVKRNTRAATTMVVGAEFFLLDSTSSDYLQGPGLASARSPCLAGPCLSATSPTLHGESPSFTGGRSGTRYHHDPRL
jgi:hypothetical protein